jgi:hypothetical protein
MGWVGYPRPPTNHAQILCFSSPSAAHRKSVSARGSVGNPINRRPYACSTGRNKLFSALGRNFQGSPALSDANPDPAAYSVLGRIIPVGPYGPSLSVLAATDKRKARDHKVRCQTTFESPCKIGVFVSTVPADFPLTAGQQNKNPCKKALFDFVTR